MKNFTSSDIKELIWYINYFLKNYCEQGENYCRVGETIDLFNRAKDIKMIEIFDILVDKAEKRDKYTFNIVKNPEDNYDIFLIPSKVNFLTVEYDKLIKILVENQIEAEVVPDVSKQDTGRFLIALYLYLKGEEIKANRESVEDSDDYLAPVDKESKKTYFVETSIDKTLINGMYDEEREVIYPNDILPFNLLNLKIVDELIGYSFYDIYEEVLHDPYLGTKIHKIGNDSNFGKNVRRLV